MSPFALVQAGLILTGCLSCLHLRADSIPLNNNKPPVTAGVFMDMYFGYDHPEPLSQNRNYFVSHARHSEVQVNLACLELKLNYPGFRASFVPGFGTYMDANYAAEPAHLRYLVEAWAGFRIMERHEVWFEAGVLPSPYTNESAFSSDQLMYSRSMGPENTPYYLSGARLGFKPAKRVQAELYLLNGWQKIRRSEEVPAFGTRLEYRPAKQWIVNWNTYIGNEKDKLRTDLGMRYFSDVYVIYNRNDVVKLASSVYGGLQERKDSLGIKGMYSWWQANLTAWHKIGRRSALSGRLEVFSDPHSVMIKPFDAFSGFTCFSGAVCFSVQLTTKVLFRMEGRGFFADGRKFETTEGRVSRTLFGLCGLTARY